MTSFGYGDVSIDDRNAGRVQVIDLSPAHGLRPRLVLRLDWTLVDRVDGHGSRFSGMHLRDVVGELRLAEHGLAVGLLAWVGQPRRPRIRSSLQGTGGQTELACDLDWARLEAIERQRAGRPPTFFLQIWPTLITEEAGVWLEAQILPFRIDIPRDVWTAGLDQWGYGTVEVIEVRYDRSQTAIFDRALDHLRDARQEIVAGKYNGAVAACRLAIDAMFVGLASAFPEAENAQTHSTAAGTEDHDVLPKSRLRDILAPYCDAKRAEAYAQALTGIKNATHLAHKTSSGPRVYSRVEAQFVLRSIEETLALVGGLMVRP